MANCRKQRTGNSISCKKAGISSIKILGMDEFMLHQFRDTSEAGLNYAHYDLAIEADQLTKYMPVTDSIFKLSGEKIKLAENGKVYLRTGTYTAIIEKNGKEVKQSFKIKEVEKSSRKKQKKTPKVKDIVALRFQYCFYLNS